MSNELNIKSARKTKGLSPSKRAAHKASNSLEDNNRNFKGVQTADFSSNKEDGEVITPSEGDSVLFLGQDARYGTCKGPNCAGGDFGNVVHLGVGFLNRGKNDENDQIDLTDPNLRYAAGISMYQRTDTGKEYAFDSEDPKDKERQATTPTPQKAVSVFQATADVIQIKGRQSVNIISGFDPTIPSFANKTDQEKANTGWVGVNIIAGNPDKEILDDKTKELGLQPIPKGDNLQQALSDMSGRINDLNKVVNKILVAQSTMEKVLMLHTHITASAVGPGVAIPSIELAGAVTVKSVSDVLNFLRSITTSWNVAAQNVNMSIVSKGHINSRWNQTN
tara:strand:+ start:4113 stop:5117 length:1005 start_codon:yes stop_codon:yes gene_type:complete